MLTSKFNPSLESGHILGVLEPHNLPNKLRHSTKISGFFNKKFFSMQGGGEGNPHQGTLNCKLLSGTGPMPFPMPIMNVVAIFGYPTYSQHVNVYDIFKRSHGYEYERHIYFQNGGYMHTMHHVRYSENEQALSLHGDFQVNAECELPEDIISLNPIVETFIPAGKGRVQSQFVLSWQRKDGTCFLARCESEYRLRNGLSLPSVLFRYAEFITDKSSATMLDLDERIWVTDALAAKNLGEAA